MPDIIVILCNVNALKSTMGGSTPPSLLVCVRSMAVIMLFTCCFILLPFCDGVFVFGPCFEVWLLKSFVITLPGKIEIVALL